MKKMGKYCKAYPIQRLRQYSGWSEEAQNARATEHTIGEAGVETPRQLTDDDFLYLQEDFTVTDGIFLDEHVIFDKVTPEWIDYCKNVLGFEVPVYEAAQASDPDNAQPESTA